MKPQIYPLSGETLVTAASMLRSRDYAAAARLAAASPAGGPRDFVAGIAAFKTKNWEDADKYFSVSANNFGLLADYALFFQSQSLQAQNKHEEALTSLAALQKQYPDSPLKRQAMSLAADIHFTRNDHKSALQAYQKFIETYPTGSDALTAQYRIALCREALGAPASAVKVLRNLWLTSPASPLAEKADEGLKRLAAGGTPPEPYTQEELYRRASTLFDLKKYALALTAFKAVSRTGQSKDFLERLDIKTGQALYRNRDFKDADALFARIAATTKNAAHASEATYWRARCQDRNGLDEEAAETFLKVAEKWPKANESDNALFEAALIRKSGQRWTDALAIIQRLLDEYPDTSLKQQAWWEGGWSAYKAGDMDTAGTYFELLAESDTSRDRALYWLSRVRANSGDEPSSQEAYATLLREFPMSFYSMSLPQTDTKSVSGTIASNGIPAIDRTAVEDLPLPVNYERVRALITFGLYEEARKELASVKLKPVDLPKLLGIARLYLEMNDYNGAYNLIRRELARLPAKDQTNTLALQFPLPFHETALRHADTNGLPLPLVYAVIRSESSFAPAAVSPAGAVGLMQLMPSTAAMVEGKGKKVVSPERLTQPELNITYGTHHMKDLISQYEDNLIAVIASYNAGSGAVNRWLRSFGALPDIEFIEQIPYPETRDYVKKVVAATAIYAQLYNLPLKGINLPLPPKPAVSP